MTVTRSGLAATIAVAICAVIQLNGQQAATGDFANAMTAEVRDAQGQIVLRGEFVVEEDDEGTEREARLEPTGIDADASGEAAVEVSGRVPARQEIEFSARNLDAGATFTFLIDGTDVATATTDQNGRVKVELTIGRSQR